MVLVLLDENEKLMSCFCLLHYYKKNKKDQSILTLLFPNGTLFESKRRWDCHPTTSVTLSF
uniref:Uncharacterized protein n=1 Tax=Manihot esculenta TaxID=3983 RepID=A0A2C9VSX2_MANES